MVHSINYAHKGRATMNTEVYRFKVGAFECIAVSDGTLTYALPTFPPAVTLLFTNAQTQSLEQGVLEYNLKE